MRFTNFFGFRLKNIELAIRKKYVEQVPPAASFQFGDSGGAEGRLDGTAKSYNLVEPFM